MEETFGAHPMNDDDFWGSTNPIDVLIDTANSEEMMAGSHITEFHTQEHKKSVTIELLNKVLNVPEVCDAVQKFQLDPLDKSKNSNMSSKTSNVTNTNDIYILSQENQDCDNQHDQQLMTYKHSDGQGQHNQNNTQFVVHNTQRWCTTGQH